MSTSSSHICRAFAAWLILAFLIAPAQAPAAVAQVNDPFAEAKAELWAQGRPENLPLAAQFASPDRFAAVLPPAGAASAAAPTPDAANPVADWSQIVFDSFRDNNYEVYTARPDGAGLARLTADGGIDVSPRISPDLSRIVFQSRRDGNYEIYTMKRDGTDLRRLTNNSFTDADPDWSPDGRQIVFRSDREGKINLYLMNADGSNVRKFTAFEYAGPPTWSPDGTEVAFVQLQPDGTDDLIAAKVADGSYRLLGFNLSYPGRPAWSRDGKRIAIEYDADGDEWTEIVEWYTAEGSYATKRTVYDANQPGYEAWMGSWSPDGKSLMFTLVAYEVVDNGLALAGGLLATVPVDGGQAMAVPGTTGLDFNPHWVSTDIQAPQTAILPLPEYSPKAIWPVSWEGSDPGGSGIVGYDVEVAIDGGSWQTIWPDYDVTTATYTAWSAGATVAFRVRGKDAAGHVEAWPQSPTADAATKIYASTVGGRVHDVRGNPVPGATVTVQPQPFNPAPTQPNGYYFSFLPSAGQTTIHPAAPGYSNYGTAARDLTAVGDLVVPHAETDFAMSDSLGFLAGGDFDGETLHQAWQHAASARIVNANEGPVHTGKGALVLGQPSTLSEAAQVTTGVRTSIAEGGGYVHVVSARYAGSGGELVYNLRHPSGAWLNQPVVLLITPQFVERFTMAADSKGGLHLFYGQAPPGDYWRMEYCYVAPNTSTCTPQNRPADSNNSVVWLTIDRQDHLHMVWQKFAGEGDERRVQYLYSTRSGGSWSAPEVIGEARSPLDAAITTDAESQPHVLWGQLVKDGTQLVSTYYTARSASGWSAPEFVTEGEGEHSDRRIAAGPDGVVHALIPQQTGTPPNHIHSFSKTPGGAWKALDAVPGNFFTFLNLQVRNGAPEVAYVESARAYHYTLSGSKWQGLAAQPLTGYIDALLLDGRGAMHVGSRTTEYNSEVFYRATQLPGGDSFASLSQTVTILDNFNGAPVNRPTLSFFLNADPGVVEAGLFRVTVDTYPNTFELHYGPVGPDGWQHVWADMTPYSSRSFNLKFEVVQPAGRPYGQVRLDDVTLGPWNTPVIESAAIGADGTVTVKASNFTGSPALKVGDQAVTATVSGDTISGRLAAAPKAGRHTVWVINPGGQRAAREVRVGQWVWLPRVMR